MRLCRERAACSSCRGVMAQDKMPPPFHHPGASRRGPKWSNWKNSNVYWTSTKSQELCLEISVCDLILCLEQLCRTEPIVIPMWQIRKLKISDVRLLRRGRAWTKPRSLDTRPPALHHCAIQSVPFSIDHLRHLWNKADRLETEFNELGSTLLRCDLYLEHPRSLDSLTSNILPSSFVWLFPTNSLRPALHLTFCEALPHTH